MKARAGKIRLAQWALGFVCASTALPVAGAESQDASSQASTTTLSIAGVQATLMTPNRMQLKSYVGGYIHLDETETVKRGNPLAQTAESIATRILNRRGLTIQNGAEELAAASNAKSRNELIVALTTDRQDVKPVRLIYQLRLEHDQANRKLSIEMEAIDTNTLNTVVNGEISVTYPPLSPACMINNGVVGNPRCLDTYVAFLTHAVESKLAQRLVK